MKLLSELAKEAIQVQDACNPLGVSKSFAEATQAIADNLRDNDCMSTNAICKHPIFQLWVAKLADMAGFCICLPYPTETYSSAYNACKRLAG